MKDGLPMGSPISGIIADIFVNHFEGILFSEKYEFFTKNIIFYKRYVDDILLIYNGKRSHIIALNNIFNNINNLQFTYEVEKCSSICFLDLTITKCTSENRILFDIYRKPTTTNTLIPKNSFTSFQHKYASFRFFFDRILNYPLSRASFNKEINTIIKLGFDNGYSLQELQNLFFRIHQARINNLIYPHFSNPGVFVSIPFHPLIQKQFSDIFNKFNVTPVYRANAKLGQLLTNNKHIFDDKLKSGIYKLNCNDCDSFYIGQTGRNISTRFKEHLNKENSTFYKHLKEHKHKTDISKIKLLKHLNKSRKMDLFEEYYIKSYHIKNPEHILNEITDFNNYNRYFTPFI
nr:uncharacterized protein LOC111417295 [Onthophagus taurus]XP_022905291.1 uncharacterized protein LOC111417295 [Onthophagus taurus]XP_022905292.1 uncharacterized protein LOC111417295 [Onthophagus taurus]